MTKLLTRWKKPDQMNTHTLCTTQWGSLKDPHSTAPVNSCRAKWSNPINRPATRAWATPPAPLRPRVYLLNHEELTKTVLLNCVQRCGKVETLCIYRMTFSTFHGLHLVVVVVLDVTLKRHCQLRVFVVDLVNELQHLLPLMQTKCNSCSVLLVWVLFRHRKRRTSGSWCIYIPSLPRHRPLCRCDVGTLNPDPGARLWPSHWCCACLCTIWPIYNKHGRQNENESATQNAKSTYTDNNIWKTCRFSYPQTHPDASDSAVFLRHCTLYVTFHTDAHSIEWTQM